MRPWPFDNLTVGQAWGFARSGDLQDLQDDAKLELAGLSAFGKSGDQAEELRSHVDPITMGRYPPSWKADHVRSGLIRLGISDPEQPNW